MTSEEKRLVDAIKAKPSHKVFSGRAGASVVVAVEQQGSVRQQSVWLGRSSTIQNLERILAA